ncbi:hypothetical protein [Limnospira platensis]|jgi:hypothetical protein
MLPRKQPLRPEGQLLEQYTTLTDIGSRLGKLDLADNWEKSVRELCH